MIVITGASSGIGLLAARKAAATGACVFLISRDGDTLARVAREIEEQGGRAAWANADVADPAALEAAARRAVAVFGKIDTWVSNAGVAIYAPLLDTPLAEHRRLVDTNYFGAVNSASIAVPRLAETGGTLIFTGSIAGDMPSPIMGAYSASKHALHAFVTALRIELRNERSPVNVALLKPSGATTPIAGHAANYRAGAARIPPPPYDPELVADAILAAATRDTRAVTVGGVGRLEVLAAQAFPALFERLAPMIIPLLNDRSREETRPGNLFAPSRNGRERSARESGRRYSLYQATRPRFAGLLLGAGAAIGLVTLLGVTRRLARDHASRRPSQG